jgi:outer membrane lipoprotein SlyB
MKKIIALALILSMTACANTGAQYRPMVDYRMSPNLGANYSQDVSECQAYAQQTASPGTGLAVGVAIGAVLAAALAGRNRYRNDTIAYGAGLGGTYGAARATETQESIVKRCMAGRGYAVLN